MDARRLTLNTRFPFSVYSDDSGAGAPLFSRGSLFDTAAMHLLVSTGIETVYVRSHEKNMLDGYLSRNTASTSRKSFYNDPVEFRNATFFKEQYFQIDKSTLKPGTMIDFNLYFLQGINFLILVKASEIEPAAIDATLLIAEKDIVIRKADIPRYKKYLSHISAESVSDQSALLKETGKMTIKELLENPHNAEKVKEVAANVETMICRIFDDSKVLHAMLSIRNSSYYVYTHSINVAVLSLALGAADGMTRDMLHKLGIGAVIHDVGLSAISPEIINKHGQLSYQEYSIYKAHVTEGEKILQANDNVSEESILAISQHHEKLSGKGYPNKLKGDDIKLFGRITAIADCFDSLITTCPYRPAYSPFDALSIMAKDKGYDPDLLKYFVQMLGKRRKSDP